MKNHVPKFGLFGLGVWLAWEYLIERSGLWLSPSEATGQILNDINVWTPIASIVTLAIIAVFQKRLEGFLHSEHLPRLAALFGVLAGIVLIITGPQFLANTDAIPDDINSTLIASLIYYLLYGEFILCGITSALFVVGFGLAFFDEKPFENLFYLLINEFVIAFIVFTVDAFDFWRPLENSPSYAVMLAVVVLPIVASWMLSLMGRSASEDDAANDADGVGQIAAPLAEDLEHIPVRMLAKCLVVLVVFAFISSIPRGMLLSSQAPELITNNSLIVLMLRAVLSLCLIIAAIRLSNDVKIEKIMIVIMVAMPLLLAVSPMLAEGNDSMVVIVAVCFDELLLAAWYLSCNIARHWRLSTISVFALGRIAVLAGLVIGWAFDLNVLPGIYENKIGVMVYCWLALAALLVLIVFFTNGDAALLSVLSVDTKNGVARLFSGAKSQDDQEERGEDPNPGKRIWHDACQEVAKESHLTPREAEIFELLSKGRTIEMVAEILCISPNTVRTHANSAYAKCNVHSRRELIGLVESKRDSIPLSK